MEPPNTHTHTTVSSFNTSFVSPLSIFWGSNLTTLDNWLFPATVSTMSNSETNTPADLIRERNTQNHKPRPIWGACESRRQRPNFLQEGSDTLNTDESIAPMKQEPLIKSKSHPAGLNNGRPFITKGAQLNDCQGLCIVLIGGATPPPPATLYRHHRFLRAVFCP